MLRRLAIATVALMVLGTVAAIKVPDSPAPAGPLPTFQGPSFGPDDWILAQRSYKDEPIPLLAYENAVDEAIALRQATRRSDGPISSTEWRYEGPDGVGGRVSDLAIDPAAPNTLYMAAATGGIWKSTDAGTTFTPAWSDRMTQSMGALAISSDSVLWAGTGEARPGGGSLVYGGSGVYRSDNGGESWKRMGLERSWAIGRIAIDPTDPKRVFVAASGPLFRPGGQRGLYLTTNGGKSWKLVLKGANATTGAADVAIDPANPDRVFATMWDHIRRPDLRVYGGKGSGLYRSEDGGKTWERLGGGLPAPSPDVGRIGVAVARTVPGLTYAVYINTNGTYQEFYTSTDGGNTWRASTVDNLLATTQSTYGWWFSRIWVDPLDPLHVFVGGVYLAESFDGGTTWTAQQALVGNLHPDHHAMVWHPVARNLVYIGTDGGVYKAVGFGTGDPQWIPALEQPTIQFYGIDVSEQDPTRIAGGAQDNGSLRTWGAPKAELGGCLTWVNCFDWNMYFGGDGEKNLINPKDHNNVFACSQYGNCARSTNGGETMAGFTGGTLSTRRNWFTPIEFDPKNPDIMYYGGDILNRSTDNGVTWQPISRDLTGGTGRDKQYPFGTLTTIAPATSDSMVVYFGTDSGRVWMTRDLGKRWTRIDGSLPDRWVTRIAVDPKDENIVYVTFSGYRAGSDDPHVVKTTDGGKTWTDITSNLPNAPTNDVIVVGDHLFVATDVGVFGSSNGGKTWLSLGKGIPIVPITDIELQKAEHRLFAATFGRGAWSVELPRQF